MPIIDIQRRHAEIGRIRLGEKGAKGQPVKLTTFRLTSPQRGLVDAVADLYGGQARPWDNAGKPEHEVTTEATSIPVIVVKGGLSQWMETWSGGGCIHRCDGRHNVLTDRPCDLDEVVQIGRDRVNPHAVAKPTTRLSVMLRDIDSLGVWRMESHGWNAAAEIPAMAELAMFVGDLVPAVLHLVERRTVKDGRTSRFVVPVLDLEVSKARLVALVGGGAAAAAIAQAPTGVAAIAAAAAPEVDLDEWTDLLADATTTEECRAIWHRAKDAGVLPLIEQAIRDTAVVLAAAEVTVPAVERPTSADVDAAWSSLVAAAGRIGWTDAQVRNGLEQQFAQPVADLDAEQLAMFEAMLSEAVPS